MNSGRRSLGGPGEFSIWDLAKGDDLFGGWSHINLCYTYDDQRGVFLAAPSGVVTEDEVGTAFADLCAHPRFAPDARIFHDFSRVTEYQVSAALLNRMAGVIAGQNVVARRAFWVGTARGYGTVTFHLRSIASEQIQVFSERAKALAWLNEGTPAERQVA